MGAKSRGNFKLGYCMRTDCTNRDKKCDVCLRFSEYKTPKGDSENDSECDSVHKGKPAR